MLAFLSRSVGLLWGMAGTACGAVCWHGYMWRTGSSSPVFFDEAVKVTLEPTSIDVSHAWGANAMLRQGRG